MRPQLVVHVWILAFLMPLSSLAAEPAEFAKQDPEQISLAVQAILKNAENVGGGRDTQEFYDETVQGILRLTGNRPSMLEHVKRPARLAFSASPTQAEQTRPWERSEAMWKGAQQLSNRVAQYDQLTGATRASLSGTSVAANMLVARGWNLTADATWRQSFQRFLTESSSTSAPVLRSFGGRNSEPSEYDACVAVRNGHDKQNGGSGVLVGTNVVVTAAHVIEDGFKDRVFLGNDVNHESCRECKVRFFARHPDYGSHEGEFGRVYENDIGVLVLEDTIDDVVPLELADRPTIDEASSFRLVGYGLAISDTGEIGFQGVQRTAILIKGSTEGVPCNPDYELVAGDGTTDSCGGDSGGPILIPIDGEQVQVAGIVSRGLPGVGLCSGGGGIYVIPDQFVEWIWQTATDAGGQLPWDP